MPIGIAVAVIAAAAGVGAFFMLKGGGAKTPEEALQGFYAAVGEGDCAKAATFVAPSFITEADLCKDIAAAKKEMGTLGKVVSTDMQGDTAYLIAERALNGVTDQRIVTVEKGEGGSWQVAGGSACYGEESPEDLGADHLSEGETFTGYSSDPPSSGPHDSTPSEMGTIFKQPQPNEQLVHSMEHGAVIFWTNFSSPKLAAQAEKAVLGAFDAGYESLIITPKADMDVPFAMTAWGSLQKCVGVDADQIRQFVDEHYAQGGEGFMACFGEEAAALPGCNKG